MDQIKLRLRSTANMSSRQAIRRMVESAYRELGDSLASAESSGRTAMRIYDLRSKLVHHGYLSDEEWHGLENQCREMVHRVLRHKFLSEIGG